MSLEVFQNKSGQCLFHLQLFCGGVEHGGFSLSPACALCPWKMISAWRWRLGSEHINSQELRSISTSMHWRLEHKDLCVGYPSAGYGYGHPGKAIATQRSLWCSLHPPHGQCLTRGSSSRKLRRTLARINALLLAWVIAIANSRGGCILLIKHGKGISPTNVHLNGKSMCIMYTWSFHCKSLQCAFINQGVVL